MSTTQPPVRLRAPRTARHGPPDPPTPCTPHCLTCRTTEHACRCRTPAHICPCATPDADAAPVPVHIVTTHATGRIVPRLRLGPAPLLIIADCPWCHHTHIHSALAFRHPYRRTPCGHAYLATPQETR